MKLYTLKLQFGKLGAIKSSIALLMFTLFSVATWAQTDLKIGLNQGNKQTSAVLELESQTKGFLMPRMNSAQIAAISNPAVGLQVFNTVDSCIYVYRGATGWYSTCAAGYTNAWSLIGNAGTNPAINFLGTTDAQPLVLKTNGTERLRFDAAGAITQSGTGVVTLTGNTKATSGLDVTNAALTANAGATITGPSTGGGTVNLNTVGANTTNIGTAVATTNINGVNFNVTALSSGAVTDSIMSVNPLTGKVARLKITDLVGAGFTANNGITKTGTNVQLGGALITPTTVSTDATNTLSLTGLQHGSAATDSIVVTTTAGILKKVAASEVASSGFTANNGLTKTGSNVALGGVLVSATTVTTDAVNTLAVSGLQHGSGLDSVVVADATTGVLKRATVSDIAAAGFLADNGLTKTGNKVQLGGALTKATTVTTTAANTLAIAGLQSGALTDSLVSVDPTTGNLRNLSIANVVSNSFAADNGLTKTGNKVQLGGALIKATAITQAGFDVNYSGGNVAIGSATAPNSTLQVTGSMGVSYKKVTTNYPLTASDNVVLANATGGSVTLTLPSASATLAGRIYTVGKSDESTNTVVFSPALYLTESSTVPSVNYAIKYRIICDGTNWWIYNE